MSVIFGLTLDEELKLLQDECKRWKELFPYEKEYFMRRVKELALQHENIMGEDLTKQLLDAIQTLSTSR